MKKYLSKLLKPKYRSLNEIEVIESNIISNYTLLQKLQPQSHIIPVLKSNAYGHGLEEMIHILNKTKAKLVAVDSFPEAKQIYKKSSKQVLIIGEMPWEVYKHCNYKRTHFCIYNPETLNHLAQTRGKKKIHLFLNTGMNREGIKDLSKFIEENKENLFSKYIEITGVCSHLASAEDNTSDLTQKQEKNFLHKLKILETYNIKPEYIHLGNSAGTFVLNNSNYNAFRVGIGLYGYNVFSKNHPVYKKAQKLKPALRVYSSIVSKQKLEPGEIVSYNETFTAKTNTNIYTVPFGYQEGLDRKLSNQGKVKINNDFYPIAGSVCMNLSCINGSKQDFSKHKRVKVISEIKSNPNSVHNISKLTQTIPYEVLTNLKSDIRRRVV